MKKFIIGFFCGFIIAFLLGINFGKDVPLWSNPFASKPDLATRVIERTGTMIDETREAIHDATKPTANVTPKKQGE